MRTSLDYAREFFETPGIDRTHPPALADLIKKAQDEAYLQGTSDGMQRFLSIASGVTKRIGHPELEMLCDTHDG
jgi:hypothetical protein